MEQNMVLRPYQQEAYDCTLAKFEETDTALCVMATGLGKCFARGTPILMHDGTIKRVEKIRLYDMLLGPDSKPRKVTSLAAGREKMYRVVPIKGSSYTVNESHILSLKITGMAKGKRVTDSAGNKYKSGEIANIDIKTYLASSRTFKHVAKGYRAGVERFGGLHTDYFFVPPYILGVWLGGGTSRTTDITTMDSEILDALRDYADDQDLKVKKKYQCGKAFTFSIIGRARFHGANRFRTGLKAYNLLNNKHIPDDYKTASISSRRQLLAGLLDTDGYYIDGCYEFVQKNHDLAEDVTFIARSLGLAAYIKSVQKTCCNTGVTGIYWKVLISGNTHTIPCRIPRKQANRRKQIKNALVTGIKVVPLCEGEYYGFTLDGPDRRFLLGDFTVVHNTIYFAHIANHYRQFGRIMVLAHREELIFQAKDKMHTITGVKADVEMGDWWAGGSFFCVSDIVVSTIQTQIAGREDKRMTRFNPDDFSLLVVDEAHHAPSESYKKVIAHYQQNPNLKVLGVTATPDRHDKKAMGQIFDEVAYSYDIRDGIDDGWLVPIEQMSVFVAGLDYSEVKSQADDLNGKDLARVLEFEENLHAIADPTVRLTNNEKTLIFAATVAQAERLTEIINRYKPNSAQFVCGKTPKDYRRDMFRDYAEGQFQYLVNVGVATEGFDEPSIECVVLARPTKSRSLFTQMIGRGTRPLTGLVDQYDDATERRDAIHASPKPALKVIDFVGNSGKHKLITTADILGGSYDSEVVELAAKNAAEKSASTGKPADVASELLQAMQEMERRRAAREESVWRDQIKLRAKYSTAKVSPFDVLDVNPVRVEKWNEKKQPSPKQLAWLSKMGVNTDGMGYAHARQVIDNLIKRIETGKPSYKQTKQLYKRGIDTSKITFKQAGIMMGELSRNGWQTPYQWKKLPCFIGTRSLK